MWQNQAYGTTYEPITFVYNKRLVPAADVPKDHSALLKLLNSQAAMSTRARSPPTIPEKSGVGYLFVNEDVKTLPAGLGPVQGDGQVRHQALYLGRRHDGACHLRRAHHRLRHLRLLRAGARRRKCRTSGSCTPKDYTLVTSRVAFISQRPRTRTPRRLFLDYLLSKRGQTIIANQADLYSLRDDVEPARPP